MDLQDYFRLRCSEMLVMERDIWQLIIMMTRDVHDEPLHQAFQRHGEVTRQQISTLEQIVDELGGITGPEDNPVSQGLLRAHLRFHDMNPPQALIDLHHALEAAKTEQLETAAYTGLIELAQTLNRTDLAQRLQQNRQSEERMGATVTSEARRLLTQGGDEGRLAA